MLSNATAFEKVVNMMIFAHGVSSRTGFGVGGGGSFLSLYGTA
jgi:hypothetical protein